MHPLINEESLELRQKYLDPDTESVVLLDWVKMDNLMRREGTAGPTWPYEFPVPKIGTSVTSMSRIGVVIDFGITRSGDSFERAVWVRFSDGTVTKLAGRDLRVVSDEEKLQMEAKKEEMKKKLIESSKKIEKMQVEKKSTSKQAHLNTKFLAIANELGLSVDEKSGFFKIVGSKKGRAIYVAKSGGRVDISGFTFNDPNVLTMTEEEAKARHLGKVRGQFVFSQDESSLLESFRKVLGELI